MKHIYLFLFPVVVLFSGQKEVQQSHMGYISNVKTSLQDSISVLDYNSLDFEKAVLSKADSASLYFLRIPFKGMGLPTLTFIFFGISSLCFLINTVLLFSKSHSSKNIKTISEV